MGAADAGLGSGGRTREASEPATDATAVTTSDTVAITNGPCRSLYIGTGGTITVLTLAGSVTQFTVPDGTVLPVCVTRVNTTGTTATNIVALF